MLDVIQTLQSLYDITQSPAAISLCQSFFAIIHEKFIKLALLLNPWADRGSPRGLRGWGGRFHRLFAVGRLRGWGEHEAGFCFRLVLDLDDQAGASFDVVFDVEAEVLATRHVLAIERERDVAAVPLVDDQREIL